ncbi:MAG: hypothetical protein IJP56_01605 [Synergistaceae bacterium]|nr:hypothetical protein [Synergistaceae bacterium]MBQ9897524.1 hypothetical protein [Synergistaceae bacterium]MBR0043519.1 hypothetical protein [Synergistaceae bacterium]MBR0222340.1 hypothetical protein [Synergistaceae bacterium]
MDMQQEAKSFLADYKELGVAFEFDKLDGTVHAVSRRGKDCIAKAAMNELASAYRLHVAVIKELEEAERQKRRPNKRLRSKILDVQDKIQAAVKLINEAGCGLEDLRVNLELANNVQ